jgi:hypothetical protein
MKLGVLQTPLEGDEKGCRIIGQLETVGGIYIAKVQQGGIKRYWSFGVQVPDAKWQGLEVRKTPRGRQH